MARVTFTANLFRHIQLEEASADGRTVGQVLDGVFRQHPQVRGYVVDDQGAVRKHVVIFVDGISISDRSSLSDPVGEDSEICIMQALSGG